MSWRRRWVEPQSGQGSRELQVHPCQVARASLHRTSVRFGVFKFGRRCDGACLERESRGLPGSMSATSGSSEWKLTAYGGSFREDNIIVLEARALLCAVRRAEIRYPPGRLLIFSDNHALFAALQMRSNIFLIAFSRALCLCVWLPGRFCPVVQVDTVRVELSRQGKSLL